MTAKRSLAIALLLLSPCQWLRADDLASENRRIVDAFFEHPTTNPSHIRDVLQKTIKELRPDSLRFESATTGIPHTRVRVKGDNPPCGKDDISAQQQLGEGLSSFGHKVLLGGLILPDPTGIGGTILVGLGVTISAIGKAISSNPFQEVANCALACSAVPGTYDKAQLESMIKVSYIYTRGDGSAPRNLAPFDSGDWFVVGDWVVDHLIMQVAKNSSPEMFGSTLIKQSNQEYAAPKPPETEIDCPVTLVCAQGKNWSHNLDRALSLSIVADIRQISSGACLDASMINKERYHAQMIKALPPDFIQTYYSEKLRQIRAQPTVK